MGDSFGSGRKGPPVQLAEGKEERKKSIPGALGGAGPGRKENGTWHISYMYVAG